MTDLELDLPPKKWTFSRPKLYGWMVGLATSVFGGLMCSVPAGAYLGIPVVICGFLLSLSFSVAMNGTFLRPGTVLGLVAAGLALLIVGRHEAPIAEVFQAFRSERGGPRKLELLGAFGIPLMLVGVHLIQLTTPWLRVPERITAWRGTLSMVLIESATVALLLGAVMTEKTRSLQAQPYWVWLAVPLAFGLGARLRCHSRGYAWLYLALMTGAALPVLWFLLVA